MGEWQAVVICKWLIYWNTAFAREQQFSILFWQLSHRAKLIKFIIIVWNVWKCKGSQMDFKSHGNFWSWISSCQLRTNAAHDNRATAAYGARPQPSEWRAKFLNNNNHKFHLIVPSVVIIFEIKINSFIIISVVRARARSLSPMLQHMAAMDTVTCVLWKFFKSSVCEKDIRRTSNGIQIEMIEKTNCWPNVAAAFCACPFWHDILSSLLLLLLCPVGCCWPPSQFRNCHAP